jgi:hypothetical protein
LNIVEAAESPGDSSHPSEDRVGWSGNIAWVLDGATDFTNEQTLPARSNVHWLVDTVHQVLSEFAARGVKDISTVLLEKVADEVRSALAKYDTSAMRCHPVCSLALLIEHDAYVEFARIGDAVALAATHDGLAEVSTSFFDAREAAAVAEARARAMSKQDIIDAMFARRLDNILGSQGESVFSGYPGVHFNVQRKTVDRTAGTKFLLCTDGLARAVNEYQMYPGWDALLEQAEKKSLAYIVSQIRHHESFGTGSRHQEKFKKSDDIAAILAEI